MYRVRREWTFREVDLTADIVSSRYALLKWFALSLGLLGESDHREGVIFVLDALFYNWFTLRRNPSFEDLKHFVSRKYLERGKRVPSDEALRHHLRKLIKIGFIERTGGIYRMKTSPKRPDDPYTAIDQVFSELLQVRDLLKAGLSHLKNLY